MAGAAGGFVTRAFESMLKESSAKKFTSLQSAIQPDLDGIKEEKQKLDSAPVVEAPKSEPSSDEAADTKEAESDNSVETKPAATAQPNVSIASALSKAGQTLEEAEAELVLIPGKWRKVAYGGMQPGFDDNHTDDSFLEEMVTNANVVERDLFKVMLDSISISQYICIVSLVVLVWSYTLESTITYNSLLLLDVVLLGSGFLVLLLTSEMLTLQLFTQYILNISYFITGLYILSPIYHTLTRSISSDSIWALTAILVVLHLFLHDYTGCTMKAPGSSTNPTLISNISLNTSIIASVLIASRLPSRQHVFAVMLFSLLVFLFAPFVMYCIKRFSFVMHLGFSLGLVALALTLVYRQQGFLFGMLLGLLVFITFICPYWLIRIQKYKFEINGPWDEAKLCFDITE